MLIRQATIDDCHGIAVVHVETWQAAYRGVVPDDYLDSMDVADREARWRENWGNNVTHRIWVAVTDSIVGWCNVGASRDEDPDATAGELYGIYVHPNQWGSGAGQELFDTGSAYLRELYGDATLWTLRENARAQRFYERNGWVVDGTAKTTESRGFALSEVRYRASWNQ